MYLVSPCWDMHSTVVPTLVLVLAMPCLVPSTTLAPTLSSASDTESRDLWWICGAKKGNKARKGNVLEIDEG